MAFRKDSMINRLSNLINRNRSAAKISQVLCSTKYTKYSEYADWLKQSMPGSVVPLAMFLFSRQNNETYICNIYSGCAWLFPSSA